ncbi:MAG TPA: HAD family phosphatase [Candidatus Saccharimonadales bacterium]|jgi:beta-phosphoglucomutase-like phosphatase (HAD superfamily)
MLKSSEMQGAIFDVDDTLLDNGGGTDLTLSLHARSRLAAVYEAAEQYDLPTLRALTPEQNVQGFMTAKVHSLPGAVWNILHMTGTVDSEDIDPSNKLFQQIVARKNELHEAVIREFGVEIPGATDFVRSLAEADLADRLAIGSSAIRRDIDIFLEKYDLTELFPESHIISLEKITRPKPDPETFQLAFASLGLPESARRFVPVFEDDPRGMLAAKRAGHYLCAITTKFSRDDPLVLAAEPDVIFDTYDELRSLMTSPPKA